MWSHLLIRWIDQQTLPMGELFNTPRRTHAMCLQTQCQLTAQHSNNRERACEYLPKQRYSLLYVSVLEKLHFS